MIRETRNGKTGTLLERWDSVTGRHTTYDSTGVLVDDRPLSADELALFAASEVEATRSANRTAVEAGITAALSKLDQLVAAPAVADVPAGTLTVAQLSSIVRSLRDVTQQNRAGAQDVARVLKQTIRLVRGDFDGTD